MLKGKNSEPVHERLFKKAVEYDEKRQKLVDDKIEKQSKIAKGKKHRGEPIYEALTRLNVARDAKVEKERQRLEKAERLTLEKEAKQTKLKESGDMANLKFNKEFNKIIENMAYHEEDFDAEDPNQKFGFNQVGGVMTTLGFVSSDLQEESTDYKLL